MIGADRVRVIIWVPSDIAIPGRYDIDVRNTLRLNLGCEFYSDLGAYVGSSYVFLNFRS